MSNAYLGAGITQGAAQVGQYMREQPERDDRRAEAKAKRNMAEAKWNEYNSNSGMRQDKKDLEMQQMKNEMYSAQAQGLRARTFSSFQAYEGDKNTKHLNNFLADAKTNPLGQKRYSDITRLDPVAKSPDNDKMIREAGIQDVEGFYANQDNPDEETATNFVIATHPDGTQSMLDMDWLYAASGYTNYMQDQELERMSKRALATSRLRQGSTYKQNTERERLASMLMEENPDMTKTEAATQAIEMLQRNVAPRSSETERLTQEIMSADPDISYADAYSQAVLTKKQGGTADERLAAQRAAGTVTPEREEVYAQGEKTPDQKKHEEVLAAKDSLDEQFEGDFLSADLDAPGARVKASRAMGRVLQEFPLSTTEKKDLKDIRVLSGLAGTAGEELTDQETGLVDSLFRGVKKYVSDNVEGTAATSSYESFRNVLRNALYGSALTPAEIAAFNKSMGSLQEQRGPVLAKLKTQVTQLRDKLGAIADMNDPYVAKYLTGVGEDQLIDMMSALDERLELFDGVQPEVGEGTKVIKSKKSLEEIWHEG